MPKKSSSKAGRTTSKKTSPVKSDRSTKSTKSAKSVKSTKSAKSSTKSAKGKRGKKSRVEKPEYDRDDISDVESDEDDLPELKEERPAVPIKYEPTRVVRIIYLHPDNRKTPDMLSRYELAEVTGIRAEQIKNAGGRSYANAPGISDPIKLAHLEVQQKRCPLKVCRQVTDNIYECWKVNELIVKDHYET